MNAKNELCAGCYLFDCRGLVESEFLPDVAPEVLFVGEATLPSLISKTAPGDLRGTAMGVYSTSQFLFAG